jgi:MFS superfamily sulfate permease-like transporter
MDSLPAIDGDLLSEILPVSITLAIIGLIESLMTQILLNQKLGSDGNASRECIGQVIEEGGPYLVGCMEAVPWC